MTTAVDALRINPPALAQKVNTELGRSGADPAPIMLLRVRPEWPYDTTLSLPGGREAQVAVCTSLLALWEQVVNHRNRSPLVLLTDLDEATLDDSLLGQVHRHRIVPIEPWDLVLTCFGAQRLDPRLRDETWAGEALLDAMPASGWPPLAGGMLSRDDALRQLAVERLGMAEIGVDAPDLDAHALMRWSTLPDAGQRLDQLRAPERDGLVRWLESYLGAPGRALFALAPAGHVSDALALGLVCDSVWPQDGATPLDVPGVRAQGAVSHHFGANLSDATIRAFAAVSTTVVTEAINDSGAASSSHPQKGTARRHRVVARLVLDRAEQLLVTFNATQTAA
ncbi:MAG: BREX-2 system phosphatase PglZ, partial [Micromonosporaceae bacterium]